jgi:hypothetical protein
MLRRGAMRCVAVVVLSVVLACPVWAGSGGDSGRPSNPDDGHHVAVGLGGLWNAAASWITGGWEGLVAQLTSDHGSVTDPDGLMATGDRGSQTDPNGATATAESDRRSVTDPNG